MNPGGEEEEAAKELAATRRRCHPRLKSQETPTSQPQTHPRPPRSRQRPPKAHAPRRRRRHWTATQHWTCRRRSRIPCQRSRQWWRRGDSSWISPTACRGKRNTKEAIPASSPFREPQPSANSSFYWRLTRMTTRRRWETRRATAIWTRRYVLPRVCVCSTATPQTPPRILGLRTTTVWWNFSKSGRRTAPSRSGGARRWESCGYTSLPSSPTGASAGRRARRRTAPAEVVRRRPPREIRAVRRGSWQGLWLEPGGMLPV
mmetsp:Transcript_13696/g.33003  ORF Transcript_13696/g.33003 Transcript_13696/m.33003 type:complete len:260 (-) Transcript_13696:26-805(-)